MCYYSWIQPRKGRDSVSTWETMCIGALKVLSLVAEAAFYRLAEVFVSCDLGSADLSSGPGNSYTIILWTSLAPFSLNVLVYIRTIWA